MATANNQANCDEVEAHCRLASAKLSQLLQKEPAATGALEDLEDYYARQMQLRVMQHNTLLDQLKEARAAQAALREMLARCARGAAAGGGRTRRRAWPTSRGSNSRCQTDGDDGDGQGGRFWAGPEAKPLSARRRRRKFWAPTRVLLQF